MKEKFKKIIIGSVFLMLQLVVSAIFGIQVVRLGMLPNKLLLLILGILFLAWIFVLFCEWKGKKLKIAGRFFCVLVSGMLLIGNHYVMKTVGAMEGITGNDGIKIDQVVVAVKEEDSAKTVEELAKEQFGVQYQLKGHEIAETVESISRELGTEISTTEYQSLSEQILGLSKGDVRAIIFNEAYLGLLEEEFPELSLRVIYTREVATKVEKKAEAQEVKTGEESFVVYISGIDVYGSINKTSRSDVNILAAVNPNTHQVLLVNTPRDYYVTFPGITGGAKDKLTHAGIYGVQASMDALGALYDIQPDFYARVNFTSMEKIVDLLGGIDVYSEYAFQSLHGKYSIEKGMNHLNGKQSLAFCRERYSLPEGDFQRGRNQQAVLTAIIEKAMSPAILTGAAEIMDSISGNVDTNMSMAQIQKLVKSQLDDPQEWEIESVDAKGKGGREVCFSMPGRTLYVTYPDDDSVREIKEMIRNVMEGK